MPVLTPPFHLGESAQDAEGRTAPQQTEEGTPLTPAAGPGCGLALAGVGGRGLGT